MIRTVRLWSAAAVTTGAAIVAALVASAHGSAQADGRVADAFAVSAFAILGALVLSFRPGHGVGRVMLTGAALWGLASPVVEWGVAQGQSGLTALVVVALAVRGAGWILLVSTLALVFPDGRLPGPRWRWVRVVVVGALTTVVLGALLQPHPIDVRIETVHNPLALPGAAGDLAEVCFLLGFALAVVAAVAGLVAVGLRWRGGDAVVREQIGWFVLACVLVPAVMTIGLFDVSTALPYPLAVVGLPVAIGLAVLQRRLYDIQHIVNRALLYGSLTVAVVAIYLLVVAGIGSMVGVRGGWWLGFAGASAAAAAVEPLRRNLQRGVNRLVYGDWEDPHDVGQRLGLRLADAAAPDTALEAALTEVASALRLRWIAVECGGTVVAEVGGPPGPPQAEVELHHEGRTIGAVRTVVGRRLRPRHITLLQSLAHQIAPVLHARALATELRLSRDRLVAAQAEERRRLLRDLHDGLGPTLAALAFKADTARNVVAADPGAETLLLEIRDRLRDTVTDVRRVVNGLRPPELDQLGLGGALTRLVGDLPGPTRFRLTVADPTAELPANVAVTAYRIVQVALTNVLRHAGAATCDIVVVTAESRLVLTVRDDGRGDVGDNHSGNGFATMRERAQELGGALTVRSGAEGGTVVTATLPGR